MCTFVLYVCLFVLSTSHITSLFALSSGRQRQSLSGLRSARERGEVPDDTDGCQRVDADEAEEQDAVTLGERGSTRGPLTACVLTPHTCTERTRLTDRAGKEGISWHGTEARIPW